MRVRVCESISSVPVREFVCVWAPSRGSVSMCDKDMCGNQEVIGILPYELSSSLLTDANRRPATTGAGGLQREPDNARGRLPLLCSPAERGDSTNLDVTIMIHSVTTPSSKTREVP